MVATWLRGLAIVLVASVLAGCATKRWVTVQTDPPGARIWINGTELDQRTPVQVPFVHYGRMDLRLEKKGYRSVATDLAIPTQLDGIPIIDLPLELATRERAFARHYVLEPLPPKPSRADAEGVLERARTMRRAAGSPR